MTSEGAGSFTGWHFSGSSDLVEGWVSYPERMEVAVVYTVEGKGVFRLSVVTRSFVEGLLRGLDRKGPHPAWALLPSSAIIPDGTIDERKRSIAHMLQSRSCERYAESVSEGPNEVTPGP